MESNYYTGVYLGSIKLYYYFSKMRKEMKSIVSDLKLILVFAVLGLVSLQQQLSILRSRFNWSNDIETFAFARLSGKKPLTQRLDYAHFLQLINKSKLHQVKLIVGYSPINIGQHVYKAYSHNGTLIKRSSSPNDLKTISLGKVQLQPLYHRV